MSLVGRQIGRYRILEQLGQGGMSVVYKGLDTTLQREVAVKVLHPHLSQKAESRKRLDREARAVARLHHPNILEVYDFSGDSSAEAYIVTEYIRGKTLRELIAAEPLTPPEIAAMVMHEISGALAHAHEAGVLHRDLKPENVMVRDDGVIKLTDFGIAKILDRDEKMTMTGALVGSPAHMAPEIIEGEESGAEADVFSLGTMLYLFVTGKLPFTAPNTTATLKRILDCVYEDPRQSVPTCSDELSEIIGTCLQRAPSNRYSTAGKLRDALSAYLAGLGLARPHEELPKFFLDAKGYRRELIASVTNTLIQRAQTLIAEKRTARALASLNQVLAHDPTNLKAAELLSAMKAKTLRAARNRRLLKFAVVAGTTLIIAFSALKGFQRADEPPEPQLPIGFSPEEVVLANVVWPKAVRTAAPIPSATGDAGLELSETVAVASPIKPKPSLVPVRRDKEKPTDRRTPSTDGNVASQTLTDVTVNVRPFGYVAVDGQMRSTDALAVHVLKLAPGEHRFLVTCDACDATGSVRTQVIGPGTDTVNIVAPLKASMLSFEGFPTDAVAQVGADTLTVAQSLKTPFRITTPPEGRRAMLHEVKYTVTHQGTLLAQDVARIVPGQLEVIRRKP